MLLRLFKVSTDNKDRRGRAQTLRAGRQTGVCGGQSARVAAPAVLSLWSDLCFPAYNTPQSSSHFLPESLESALETLAEQSIQQRIDVRVQQHQPVREGNSRGWHKGGLA